LATETFFLNLLAGFGPQRIHPDMYGSITPRTLSAYKRLGGGGQQRLDSSEVSQPPPDFYRRTPESVLTSCATTLEPRLAEGGEEKKRRCWRRAAPRGFITTRSRAALAAPGRRAPSKLAPLASPSAAASGNLWLSSLSLSLSLSSQSENPSHTEEKQKETSSFSLSVPEPASSVRTSSKFTLV